MLPPFEQWAKLLRHAELPSPTLMASMTTEYVASRNLALLRGIDLIIGLGYSIWLLELLMTDHDDLFMVYQV